MSEPSTLVGARACGRGSWLVVVPAGRHALELSSSGAADVDVAEAEDLEVVLAGTPYGLPEGSGATAAQRVLAAYRERGRRLLGDLGGIFALVIRDRRDDSVLMVRDPLGIHPLFYARTPAGLMAGPTIGTLLGQPEVPGPVDRVAVANHLRQHWPDPEATFFEGVLRVPQGHWTRVGGGATTTERYWDPLFPGRDPEWVDQRGLGRFQELLDASVARSVGEAGTGIFLSGGLDSVSVAAFATDRLRRRSGGAPLALSLVFPPPQNEDELQTSVASQLGMAQLLTRLEDALEGQSVVRAATERGAFGAPIQNPWLPAYRWLAGQAGQRGCEVILTGSGGDEWLTVTPLYAGDLLRTGRFLRLARLWRVHAQSYDVAPHLLAKNLLWRFGAYPMLARRREALWRRIAPDAFAAREVAAMQRSYEARSWLAPDRSLREELRARDEEYVRRAAPSDDLLPLSGPREYFRECRIALTHPLVSMEAEEVHEYSRSQGVRIVHPYSDTRLVEFLHATPPELLNTGGFSKGLIREMLRTRFPTLGFERQRKLITANFFGRSVVEQAPGLWRERGGATALADLGIVDSARADALFHDAVHRAANATDPDYTVTDPMWNLLTTDGWLRQHA